MVLFLCFMTKKCINYYESGSLSNSAVNELLIFLYFNDNETAIFCIDIILAKTRND